MKHQVNLAGMHIEDSHKFITQYHFGWGKSHNFIPAQISTFMVSGTPLLFTRVQYIDTMCISSLSAFTSHISIIMFKHAVDTHSCDENIMHYSHCNLQVTHTHQNQYSSESFCQEHMSRPKGGRSVQLRETAFESERL